MDNIDSVISVANISKVYRLGIKDEMHETFAATVTDFIKNPLKNYKKHRSLYRFDDILDKNGMPIDDDKADVLWALKNVSFEVMRGDVLGVIGGNGAGKSTLLKILSRVTHPTSGKLEIRGRVGSLLEVGTGFHPDLSGRDNIYLNGTVLGMRKAEVDRKLDQIIDFSGVEKFIDTPVKRYSSGMTVRLAFSVAAHLEPEILIIDEVLAVGDAEFQKKCLDKMEDVGKGGRTVVFVSHNMAAVSALCTKGLVIQNGQVAFEGSTSEAVNLYMGSSTATTAELPSRNDRAGKGNIKMQDIWFENSKGQRTTDIRLGETMSIKGKYTGAPPDSALRFVFEIYSHFIGRIIRFDTTVTGVNQKKWPEQGVVSCTTQAPITLCPGGYQLLYAIYDRHNELEDYLPDVLPLHIIDDDFYGTGRLFGVDKCRPMFFLKHSWGLE